MTQFNNSLIHALDESESKLAMITRRRRSDLTLLKNARIALRKGKTHIVDDHISRVIEAIQSDVSSLTR